MSSQRQVLGISLAAFTLVAIAFTDSPAGGLGGLAKSIKNLKPSVPNVNPNGRPENKPQPPQAPKEEKFVELEFKSFGFFLIKPDADVVKHFNLPAEGGLMVSRVKADSPAAKAGLKENDLLVELAGSAIPRNLAAFSKTADALKSGTAVDLTYLRAGKRETIKGLVPQAPLAKAPSTF